MNKPTKYGVATLNVRYAETDQMGVVYHANYIIWLELGRESFLTQILNKNYIDLEKSNLLAPIVDVHVSYLKPAKYGDTITIHTWAKQVSPIRVTYAYEIRNQDDILLVKATTTGVVVDKETFTIKKLHTSAPEWYNAYKAYIETYITQ